MSIPLSRTDPARLGYAQISGTERRTVQSSRRRLLWNELAEAIRVLDFGSDALLFIDLDGFKEINDRFGHAVGDAVLRDCATRLCQAIRDGETAARIGGDEFAVIL